MPFSMVLCDPISDEEYARRNRYCRRPYCHHPPRFFTIFLFKIHAIHSKYSTESRFCQGGAPFFCTAVPEAPPAMPIPATSSFFARRPFLPAGEKQDVAYGNLHKCLPVRSEPAFSALFSRSRVAFCPRLMQVFRQAFLQKGRQPAPQRSICRAAHPLRYPRGSVFPARPYPRPGRIHGAPRFCHMPVPIGSEGGRPLYPRARGHALRTVCPLPRYPPPRPFRRRIPSRHGPRVAPTPPAVYAERQHRTCRRPRRGPVPAAAHLQGFSPGLFAKRPTTRAAALYLPHLPSSAPPRRGFPH